MALLFDFECTECGNIFEELVHKDKLQETCPECGNTKATRLISAPRIDPKLGLSDDFPTAVQRWERIRRDHHTKGAPSDNDD